MGAFRDCEQDTGGEEGLLSSILLLVYNPLKRIKTPVDTFVGCYTDTPSENIQTLIYGTRTEDSIRYHDVNKTPLLFVCHFNKSIEDNLNTRLTRVHKRQIHKRVPLITEQSTHLLFQVCCQHALVPSRKRGV